MIIYILLLTFISRYQERFIDTITFFHIIIMSLNLFLPVTTYLFNFSLHLFHLLLFLYTASSTTASLVVKNWTKKNYILIWIKLSLVGRFWCFRCQKVILKQVFLYGQNQQVWFGWFAFCSYLGSQNIHILTIWRARGLKFRI